MTDRGALRRCLLLALVLVGGCGGTDAETPDGGGGAADAGGDGAATGDGAMPDGAGSVDATPPIASGSVTDEAGACQRGVGTLARTTCRRARVACPGVADMVVELRVTEPPAGVPRLGTVIFGTGGGGGGFYDQDATAQAMLARLAGRGFRVVQRAWNGALDGWLTGPGGVGALSCRYGALLGWVHQHLHAAGTALPMCASGNSGGSAEVAYALARWGGGELLDLAVPSGGPPMGRIDHGCLDGADPTWVAECRALVPAASFTCGQVSCAYNGSQQIIDNAYTPAQPCGQALAAQRATFLADSVLAPGALLAYPRTRVHFVMGAQDCSEAVSLGLLWHRAISTDKQLTIVPATPHAVFSTSAGAAAIEDAIVQGCVARH